MPQSASSQAVSSSGPVIFNDGINPWLIAGVITAVVFVVWLFKRK